MESKLDILTKKLYDEGVVKAQEDAKQIISDAQQTANNTINSANQKASEILKRAHEDIDNLKQKAEAEMSLSARQALTALKGEFTDLLAGEVSKDITNKAFNDKQFMQELIVSIVKKWDITSGNIDLNILLNENDKTSFEQLVNKKYKELLDKGVEIKTGKNDDSFTIEPKNGGYQLKFSEELFESFFNQYIKSFTKKLLYK